MNTHCKRGHEYTPENTYVYNGSRMCKECVRINGKCRNKSKTPTPLVERFSKKVDASIGHGPLGDCHIWIGYKDKDGYGIFYYNNESYRAHRMAFELVNGSIPIGLSILHKCDNTACVNPEHLRTGTQAENNHDRSTKGRSHGKSLTHCKRGHEFSEKNTRTFLQNGVFVRQCRVCDSERQRNSRIKSKQALCE